MELPGGRPGGWGLATNESSELGKCLPCPKARIQGLKRLDFYA